MANMMAAQKGASCTAAQQRSISSRTTPSIVCSLRVARPFVALNVKGAAPSRASSAQPLVVLRSAEVMEAPMTEDDETDFIFNLTDARKNNTFEESDVIAAMSYFQEGLGSAPIYEEDHVSNFFGSEDASYFDDIDNNEAYEADEFCVAGIPEAAPKQRGRGGRRQEAGKAGGDDEEDDFSKAREQGVVKAMEDRMVMAAQMEEMGLDKKPVAGLSTKAAGPAVWDWMQDFEDTDSVSNNDRLSGLVANPYRAVSSVADNLPSDEVLVSHGGGCSTVSALNARGCDVLARVGATGPHPTGPDIAAVATGDDGRVTACVPVLSTSGSAQRSHDPNTPNLPNAQMLSSDLAAPPPSAAPLSVPWKPQNPDPDALFPQMLFSNVRASTLGALDINARDLLEFLVDDFDLDNDLKMVMDVDADMVSNTEELPELATVEQEMIDEVDALLKADLSLPELDADFMNERVGGFKAPPGMPRVGSVVLVAVVKGSCCWDNWVMSGASGYSQGLQQHPSRDNPGQALPRHPPCLHNGLEPDRERPASIVCTPVVVEEEDEDAESLDPAQVQAYLDQVAAVQGAELTQEQTEMLFAPEAVQPSAIDAAECAEDADAAADADLLSGATTTASAEERMSDEEAAMAGMVDEDDEDDEEDADLASFRSELEALEEAASADLEYPSEEAMEVVGEYLELGQAYLTGEEDRKAMVAEAVAAGTMDESALEMAGRSPGCTERAQDGGSQDRDGGGFGARRAVCRGHSCDRSSWLAHLGHSMRGAGRSSLALPHPASEHLTPTGVASRPCGCALRLCPASAPHPAGQQGQGGRPVHPGRPTPSHNTPPRGALRGPPVAPPPRCAPAPFTSLQPPPLSDDDDEPDPPHAQSQPQAGEEDMVDVESELLDLGDDNDDALDGAPPEEEEDDGIQWTERIIQLTRVTKVVKGGKLMGFRCTAVVGNQAGLVGVGCAAGREVATAVKRALVDAKKSVVIVSLVGSGTLPHRMEAKFHSARMVVLPASEGTGCIAGGAIRSVLELAGVKDCLAKRIGCRSPLNNARCTIKALTQMRSLYEVSARRGVPMSQLLLPKKIKA
ncbi:MAG: hypothetical protein WDW36_000076 [Sanguina aurantia]